MQFKFIHEINSEGLVVNVRLADSQEPLKPKETDIEMPDSLFKPRFDLVKKKWFEGATKSELLEVEKVLTSEVPKTELELVQQELEEQKLRADTLESTMLELADSILN